MTGVNGAVAENSRFFDDQICSHELSKATSVVTSAYLYGLPHNLTSVDVEAAVALARDVLLRNVDPSQTNQPCVDLYRRSDLSLSPAAEHIGESKGMRNIQIPKV